MGIQKLLAVKTNILTQILQNAIPPLQEYFIRGLEHKKTIKDSSTMHLQATASLRISPIIASHPHIELEGTKLAIPGTPYVKTRETVAVPV